MHAYVLLAGVAALAACRNAGPASPPAAGGPDTTTLAREIPRLLEGSGVPGLSIAVVRDGRVIWAGAYGTRGDSAHAPVDTATVFEAASLSKPVFAYLALRLADQGVLDLDRPLAELLAYPRLPRDERARRITARLVLSHGTGLPNWGGEQLTLQFEPGTAYGYSGEGFVYLQRAIERVTGQSLEALARREVFEPLGMTRSSYVWQPRFEGNAAHAKDWLWRVAPIDRWVEPSAAYTLLTTAPDYARFVGAVLTGRGLSAATWQSFLTPVRETSPGGAMALGVRVENGPDGRIFYHGGNNGRRFTCYMTGDVGRRTGFVYFTNASNGASLVAALAKPVFGGAPSRHRAEYDRFDDPRLVAVRSVQRAATAEGPDAARARLREIRAESSAHLSGDDVLALGEFFAGRGLAPLSLEVLGHAVADAPRSGAARLSLGRAQEAAGRLDAALDSYRRAQALGADREETGRLIRWVEERLAARARLVVVDPRTLARYPGRYLERRVTMRDGRLFYTNGASPVSPLTPMTDRLFEVAAEPTARVRFEDTGSGRAGRIVVLYSDGTADQAVRFNEPHRELAPAERTRRGGTRARSGGEGRPGP
jgi:CubicO group peptidase (beta-lactamase class C family)